MLTADLVRVRKKGSELLVSPLKGKTRERALELAERYLTLTGSLQGQNYEQLRDAYNSVPVGPREKKLADGLRKLIEDQCEFALASPVEPRALRQQVFLSAAARRRERGREWARDEILREIGERYELTANQVELALFSDLKGQHQLLNAPRTSAQALLDRYEIAQVQAVLLRAVQVRARVFCRDVSAYRELFRALKFRRLLYSIVALDEGYELVIDGPFSLFESVTKYGVQLALVFPALLRCSRLELRCDVRWGKARTPLVFNYEQRGARSDTAAEQRLPDEVQALWDAFDKLGSGWSVARNQKILNLPGVGVCIPDLVFSKGGLSVLFEVMGFWSRDAVWKRVELVEAGLPERVIFAVSTRLRVSEAVLDDHDSAALYAYKGSMSARAVLKRLERVTAA